MYYLLFAKNFGFCVTRFNNTQSLPGRCTQIRIKIKLGLRVARFFGKKQRVVTLHLF